MHWEHVLKKQKACAPRHLTLDSCASSTGDDSLSGLFRVGTSATAADTCAHQQGTLFNTRYEVLR